MSTPLETVRAFVAALERKDLDLALTLVSEDCEYDNVPMGKNFGREAMRTVLTPFLLAASEVEWIIHREAETGNVVFNERVDRFLLPHGWVEIAVTGVWEVVDGRITLWRDYFDIGMYASQMPKAS